MTRMVSADDPTRSSAGRVDSQMVFHSVLFRQTGEEAADLRRPGGHFADLHLDQVQQTLASQRDVPDLDAVFTAPLRDRADVRYRHEVFNDLRDAAVLGAVESFSAAMDDRQELLREITRSRHRLQQQSLSLEAIEAYGDATIHLARDLQQLDLTSSALSGLRATLIALVGSERFTTSRAMVSALQEEARALRYTVLISGARITVGRYDGEPDHGAELRSVFSRFTGDKAEVQETAERRSPQLDVVESQILDGVEALHPKLFATRAQFLADPAHQVNAAVERFHREVQFYLAWLDLIQPLRDAGLPFCLPEIVDTGSGIALEDGFDLALATSVVADGLTVVTNNFHLAGPERMFIVTGANNGGKTTFARMVGQLLHLVALGVPVPGREARLPLPDQVFTHFERDEGSSTQVGKFLDELQRVQTILQEATVASVVILNESFSSTSLTEAVQVGTRVVEALLDLGCIGVFVTFMDEIASLSDQTVSMVTRMDPKDPASRTFTFERAPADGQAHASAIAEKYGLTHDRLVARMRR